MTDDDGDAVPFVFPDDEHLLQVVGTEALVLQNKRSALATEAVSRSSLFVAVVSGGLVAAGFVAATPSAGSFLLVVVPIVLVLGVVTFVRLVTIARDDRRYDRQLERIRAGFATVSPRGAHYFRPQRAGGHDWPSRLLVLSSTAGLIALIDAAIAGAGVALVLARAAHAVLAWHVVVGVGCTVAVAAAELRYAAVAVRAGWRGPAGTPAP